MVAHPNRSAASPGRPGRKANPFLPGDLASLPAYLTKLILLAAVVALACYSLPQLYSKQLWVPFAAVALATVLILWVYLGRRRIHLKYLVPGTLLLIVFQVYPIIYLISISVTNYGDGHFVNEQQAIAANIADSVEASPNAPTYSLAVATKGRPADCVTGAASCRDLSFVFFVTDLKGKVFLGTATGLEPVPRHGLVLSPSLGLLGPEGGLTVTAAPGWNFLGPVEVNNLGPRFEQYSVPLGHSKFLRAVDVTDAEVEQATLAYDKRTGELVNTSTGTVYKAVDGYFVPTKGSGQPLPTGFEAVIGAKNFTSVITSSEIRGPFLKILAWTFSFAILSVLGTFAIGLFLATVLNHPRLRGKSVYRSVYLLPYAVPGFVSILVWATMFNGEFGLINNLFHLHVAWLQNPWWAKFVILLTNLWLGFPYMFLVSIGVLQSIPADLVEAAQVDGCSGRRAFRHVTFPLLLVTVEPLLIGSFAFNFNNFNVIQLLTGGGPFTYNSVTAGSTDLVISYTYRLAFNQTSHEYGFAAALSVFLFILVAAISISGLRRTQAFRTMT
ncbi:MAG TPA: ABC transporter permease subunit [Acidimicrobiales bacterium]|nr:ABC transporter permease subunit [Acidimicrobiales bacterium]